MSEPDVDPLLRRMDEQFTGWVEPVQRLRQALERDDIALFCQPILSLQGGTKFPLAEVLVRMREEERAMLPPGEFLPVFEHYRLMPALDLWVVQRVLRHLVAGSRIPQFSINLSNQSLEDPDFASNVARELMKAGIPGSSLVFEVAEADTLSRHGQVAQFSKAVHALGCGLAVDGFGRRTVSFSALKALRVDHMKVDGSITRNLLGNPGSEPKLRAILRVGEALGYKVTAEMVEEQNVLLRLKALGAHHAQGFGIQQPYAIEKVAGSAPLG